MVFKIPRDLSWINFTLHKDFEPRRQLEPKATEVAFGVGTFLTLLAFLAFLALFAFVCNISIGRTRAFAFP